LLELRREERFIARNRAMENVLRRCAPQDNSERRRRDEGQNTKRLLPRGSEAPHPRRGESGEKGLSRSALERSTELSLACFFYFLSPPIRQTASGILLV